MRKIDSIVVHCTDSPDDRDVTASDVHRWHKERGFDGIGYHFLIKRDGTVEGGRPLYWSGAHVKGNNSNSIGVCLVGRGLYSEDQYKSLKSTLDVLLAEFQGSKLYGHCDLDAGKTCPNIPGGVKAWYERGLSS